MIVNAQKPIESTNQFTIMGMVDKPKIVFYIDLEKENSLKLETLKLLIIQENLSKNIKT